MPLAARVTGCSRKRSVTAGAGGPMSMRMPSTTSPLATLRTRPSDRRVSCQHAGAPPGSARRSYSLACSWVASVTLRLTLADELPGAVDARCWLAAAPRPRRPRRSARRHAAGGSLQVQAQRLLLVDLARQRRRQLAEQRCGHRPGRRSGSAAARRSRRRRASCVVAAGARSRSRTGRAPTRVASLGSTTTVSGCTCVPSTRRWPPPMKTATVPSSASTVLTCTLLAQLGQISRSRSSSRSLGGWPRPCTAAMRWFSSAMLLASWLTSATVAFSVVAARSAAARRAARRRRAKRSARSPARASTTWRVAASPGRPAGRPWR